MLDTFGKKCEIACVPIIPKATKQLRQLIAAYGNVNAAATAFELDSVTINRLLANKGISLRAAANIIEATKLPYEKLFEHQPEEAKR